MKRFLIIFICILCLGIGGTAGVFGYKYWNEIEAFFKGSEATNSQDKNTPQSPDDQNHPADKQDTHNITFVSDNYNKTFKFLDGKALNKDSAISNLESPSKAGYDFLGWYLQDDEEQTVVNFDYYRSTGDVTFVAKFEPHQETIDGFYFKGTSVLACYKDDEKITVPSSYSIGRTEKIKFYMYDEGDFQSFYDYFRDFYDKISLPFDIKDSDNIKYTINSISNFTDIGPFVSYPLEATIDSKTFIVGSDYYVNEIDPVYFDNCPNLVTLELPETINSLSNFYAPGQYFQELIINSTSVPSISGSYATNISDIYVKDDLYDQYIADREWENFALFVHKLSEYGTPVSLDNTLPYAFIKNSFIHFGEYIGDKTVITADDIPTSVSLSRRMLISETFTGDDKGDNSIFEYIKEKVTSYSYPITLKDSTEQELVIDTVYIFELLSDKINSLSFPITASYFDRKFIKGDAFKIKRINGQFSGNDKITKVVIPEGIESIISDEFSDCNNLIELELPKSFLSELSYFDELPSCLKILTLNSDIELFRIISSSSCNSLEKLILKGTESICTLDDSIVAYLSDTAIYVADELYDTYTADQNWSQISGQIHKLSEYEE